VGWSGAGPSASAAEIAANIVSQVRKTPSCPKSWANLGLLWLYSHRGAWANLHLLGQPDTFLAPDERQIDIVSL
jgi:hypothetical protein